MKTKPLSLVHLAVLTRGCWFGPAASTPDSSSSPPPPAVPTTPQQKSKNLVASILKGKIPDKIEDLETVPPVVTPPGVPPDPAAPPPPPVDPNAPPAAPKVDPPVPPAADDAFGGPVPGQDQTPPVDPNAPPVEPDGTVEGHRRAMETIRTELKKVAKEKEDAQAALAASNTRITTMEKELKELRENPGILFQPPTKEDVMKDPSVSGKLDSLERTVNTLMGDVSEATALLLEPDLDNWMKKADGVEADAAKRRAFVKEVETEFPTEDARSIANHLINAAKFSKEVADAAAALMAEPAKNGMARARKDWEDRNKRVAEYLTMQTNLKDTAVGKLPFHPITYINSLIEKDPNWKAASEREWASTVALFSGVEPLADSDTAAFTGAFDEGASKEIANRREAHEKNVRTAAVQMYAIKLLAPLLQPALQALAEKQSAEQQKIAERQAVGSGTVTPAPTPPPPPPSEPVIKGPLDILRHTGLFPQKKA